MITKSRENDAVQNGENRQFSSIRIRKSRENEVDQNLGEIGNFAIILQAKSYVCACKYTSGNAT